MAISNLGSVGIYLYREILIRACQRIVASWGFFPTARIFDQRFISFNRLLAVSVRPHDLVRQKLARNDILVVSGQCDSCPEMVQSLLVQRLLVGKLRSLRSPSGSERTLDAPRGGNRGPLNNDSRA